MPEDAVRPFELIIDNFDLFGVNWYEKKYLCATVAYTPTDDGFEMRPLGPMRIEPAAWWRRLGFRVLRPIDAWLSKRHAAAE
jgi:hypothetical protein